MCSALLFPFYRQVPEAQKVNDLPNQGHRTS